MDVRNLLLGLNGCESEIAKLQNKAFVEADLSAIDRGMLGAYRERKHTLLETLDRSGYLTVLVDSRWCITTKEDKEGVYALLNS